MSIGFTENAYVYGNYVHDNNDAGVRIKEMNTGKIFVFSNILAKNKERGFWFETIDNSRQNTGNTYFNGPLHL